MPPARPSLLRTSSFRLALLYVGLFAVSVTVIFGVIYRSTADFMTGQFDAAVADEVDEVRSAAPGDGTAALGRAIAAARASAPKGTVYLLEDAAGAVSAGDLPALPPRPGPQDLILPSGRPGRGQGVVLPGGRYLFVAMDSSELHRIETVVARAFMLGSAASIAVALAGGAVIGFGLLRRIEGIGRTGREIVEGDLSRRIVLSRRGDEFDFLAAGINVMLERIEVLMGGLREVSTDIAHDLRTPLSRLRQRLERARRGSGADELRAALDASVGDVDAILDTFGALLRIAQIEAGSRRAGFVDLDLSELLRGMVEIYLPVAEERGQRIGGAVAPGLMVKGDRELLTQMLANLVENALRHAPAGAAVTVAGRRNGPAVEAEIADTGPGIPPELRGKVFQRFYRLEASRTTPGNGLGLSLVAAVCDLHRVAIELSDNAPGLRMRLRFPVG